MLDQPDVAPDVVGEVGQGDLRGGPGHADGPDHQAEGLFLVGEDALHRRTHFRSCPVGLPLGRCQILTGPAAEVDLGTQAPGVEEGFVGLGPVGGVRPDIGRLVAGNRCRQLSAVVGRRRRHGEAPDQAMRLVDADVVLIAEHRNGDLHPGLGAVCLGLPCLGTSTSAPR